MPSFHRSHASWFLNSTAKRLLQVPKRDVPKQCAAQNDKTTFIIFASATLHFNTCSCTIFKIPFISSNIGRGFETICRRLRRPPCRFSLYPTLTCGSTLSRAFGTAFFATLCRTIVFKNFLLLNNNWVCCRFPCSSLDLLVKREPKECHRHSRQCRIQISTFSTPNLTLHALSC
jgi:hypothetical protein